MRVKKNCATQHTIIHNQKTTTQPTVKLGEGLQFTVNLIVK